jgi:hypothetical protein
MCRHHESRSSTINCIMKLAAPSLLIIVLKDETAGADREDGDHSIEKFSNPSVS